MRILYLTNHLNTGGITRYLLDLSCAMKKRGHEVFIASGGGELQDEFSKAGVHCVAAPFRTKCEFSPKVLRGFLRLLPLVKERRIDIIHCNTRVTQAAGCLLSRYSGRPYVSTCHGFFKPRLSRRLFPLWGARVIAISDQVKEHLVRDLGVGGEKISVINHGVDTARFGPTSTPDKLSARKGFGLPEHANVIGIIARLSDVKGHCYLLEAMPQVIARDPSVILWIIGEGPMQKELFALARKLKIERNVVFTPKTADTAAALGAMDVFVMPSVKEGLGLALMEAMAAGLAVIGSNVGGIKTLIRDGVDGLLVSVGDSAGLGYAMARLLLDKQAAANLGQRAREKISRQFPFENMIGSTEEVYAECLKGKSDR